MREEHQAATVGGGMRCAFPSYACCVRTICDLSLSKDARKGGPGGSTGDRGHVGSNPSSCEGEAMAAYNFDDHNIKWNKLGELEHLLYSILNIDEKNHIIDVLFKFDANEKIVLHRHMVHNNTFVVQGEHRLYEPNGEIKEIRPVGT
jgi:hypothetical protein